MQKMKSPTDLLMDLLVDISRLHCGAKGTHRDIITMRSRFKNEGYSFLTITLPILGNAIDRGLADGRFACPKNFKRVPRGSIPRLLSGLICEVFDTYTGLLVEEPPVDVILSLRQICYFFKKVVPNQRQVEELDRKAKDDFCETDDECGIPREGDTPRIKHLLSQVCRMLAPGLDTFDPGALAYRHGPGGVYEGAAKNQRWFLAVREILSGSRELFDSAFGSVFPFERTVSDPSTSGDHQRCKISQESSKVSFESQSRLDVKSSNRNRRSLRARSDSTLIDASGGFARLVTVPKSSVARRTITVEPSLEVFLQLGYNEWLRDQILECRILKNILHLSDQAVSQKLALEGSRTGAYATLDLKSASDLLSEELVRLVFADRPRFLSAILGCRTPGVDVSSTRRRLRKYAGMGNGTTFPVQSYVFAAICLAAIHDQDGTKPTYRTMVRASRHICVYGDDIIVPSRYSLRVTELLTQLGLRVNRNKSFESGKFRESCGVDAWNGTNVTPTYLREDPMQRRADPSVIGSLVSTSNQLWLKGYYKASACLKDRVETMLKHSLPLVPEGHGSLGWHTRTGWCSVTNWDRDLQHFYVKGWRVVSRKVNDPIDGYAALLKFFLTPLIGREKGHLSRSSQKYRNGISACRMPAYAGPVYH